MHDTGALVLVLSNIATIIVLSIFVRFHFASSTKLEKLWKDGMLITERGTYTFVKKGENTEHAV